jgi:hypothetical protein
VIFRKLDRLGFGIKDHDVILSLSCPPDPLAGSERLQRLRPLLHFFRLQAIGARLACSPELAATMLAAMAIIRIGLSLEPGFGST